MASTVSFGDGNRGLQADTINGGVQYHLPPERPETPPRPSIVIPFDRDADFVKRETILDRICAASGSRAALVGLGGVGKSQLAIEHAYRTHDSSPETWVFWVHASNSARFEESFRHIANRVRIVGRQNPQANVFELVYDWLCNSKNPWLLILDNVDDAGFLLHAQADGQGQPTDGLRNHVRPLREYLPHCRHGSILITSRSKEAALKLVEQRNIIAIGPMDEAQASALFEMKLGAQANTSNILKLAIALEFMPLAIAQAAAYISQRSPRCTVTQYLEELQNSDREKTSLLDYDASQLRRDREASNSILGTWQISFDHIRRIRPSATDLLSLMSFFDRQGIPEALICHHEGAEGHEINKEGYNKRAFEEDVDMLQNYSFITVIGEGTTFEMHALVQLATRTWLASTGKLEQWRRQFISNLSAAFPTTVEFEDWATCQQLFPHAKAAVGQRPDEQSSLVEWASLLYHAAWYAYDIGNSTAALEFALKSMEARSQILGEEHEDTLCSIDMVALAYKLGGQWDIAEKLEVQLVETRKKKLGADHPDTLTSIDNLASTYWNQGRLDAAEELQLQVLETRKKKLGADHLRTLTSMANLASTYWNQGRLDAAEELEVQVVETLKKKLGADHPDTLISMANLAKTWKSQGKVAEALNLQRNCVRLSQLVLPPNHPDLTSRSAWLNELEADFQGANESRLPPDSSGRTAFTTD